MSLWLLDMMRNMTDNSENKRIFGGKIEMVFIVFLDCVVATTFFSGFPLLWVIDCSQITTHTLSTVRAAEALLR